MVHNRVGYVLILVCLPVLYSCGRGNPFLRGNCHEIGYDKAFLEMMCRTHTPGEHKVSRKTGVVYLE
jgi:hypothetical protein